MSLTAVRNFSSRSALVAHYNEGEAEQEIKNYIEGVYESYWELTQEEADSIAANRGNHDDLMERLSAQGKSAGARYIAARINSGDEPDLKQLAKDWWSHRAIKRELSKEELIEIEASAMNLRMLGIKTGWQARRFYELYKEVRVKDRPWGSCYQVNHHKVLAMATTPNYNRLPLWVKKGLVENDVYIQTERIGNIWRLPDCVRAWKWCPALPKGIAEKVGRMSMRGRVLAALAWREVSPYRNVYDWRIRNWGFYEQTTEEQVEFVSVPRYQIITQFWTEFRKLERVSLLELITRLLNKSPYEMGTVRCIVEGLMGLPYQALKDEWPSSRYDDTTEFTIVELIARYSNPKEACQYLFGVSGKATIKAFQQCQSKDAWRWAGALAQGNPDAVQKILKMTTLIEWQSEAVNFLMSLPMVSRLRMLQATEFKYRGEVHPISPDHVRDTGYLWSNIQNKPELGRVRCWFSVHETLAAAFVKELPDELLPIPAGWERIDGLCAVDGSWELEFPKRVATLKYYGQLLNNCVGGYGPAIKSGRSTIFVVREYGQITHCVEFCNGYCNQFYQAGNRGPDYNVKESVLQALEQAKV